MNEELLKTQIVSLSITRWLNNDLGLDGVLEKLEDIHLIIISKDELLDFIKANNLDKENKLNSINNRKV